MLFSASFICLLPCSVCSMIFSKPPCSSSNLIARFSNPKSSCSTCDWADSLLASKCSICTFWFSRLFLPCSICWFKSMLCGLKLFFVGVDIPKAWALSMASLLKYSPFLIPALKISSALA